MFFGIFIVLPGTPTTVAFEATSLTTTQFAPIFALSPILTFPSIFAPHPN